MVMRQKAHYQWDNNFKALEIKSERRTCLNVKINHVTQLEAEFRAEDALTPIAGIGSPTRTSAPHLTSLHPTLSSN